MVDIPEPGFQKYWRQTLSLLKSESHAITNKYPEADFVVRVHKVTLKSLPNAHQLEWGKALSGQLL
jgi:hypothetical protein